MKPIKNFTDHPSLKYDSVQSIFTITGCKELYLFSEDKEVKRILPISAQYTNIGEPYHSLVRFYFFEFPPYLFGKGEENSLDIDLKDLPDLIIMLLEIGIDLPLDKELQKYIDNE